MEQQFTTPMMKQYEKIKKGYQDCLLFYRMGDFYELFLDDALVGSKVLDITLTSRSKGKDGRIPMAGVPYHAVDSYLSKLVKAGHKVAICEQMTEPNKRGIIDREVVRVVTPGTVLDEKALNKNENNFIVSIVFAEKQVGIAACDISTGYFETQEIQFSNLSQTIRDELARTNPAECILSEDAYNTPEILKLLNVDHNLNLTCYKDWESTTIHAQKYLKNHFKVATLESFGIDNKVQAIEAAAALLGYLKETQKDKVEHIVTLKTPLDNEYVLMDKSTMINLELFTTIREHDTRGTLLSVLDETTTAMGGRMLRTWLKKPLSSKEHIVSRQDAVEELSKHLQLRSEMKRTFRSIADIERLVARLSVGIGNARDVINLKYSLIAILQIREYLSATKAILLKRTEKNISTKLSIIIDLIDETIVEDPPISIREGGMIKKKVNVKLDTLQNLVGGGKEWISKLEADERKRTGINSLKVRFNKVFGFYIEVSKSNASLVPKNYFRKQTLVNGERFITPELKKQEELILSAQEEINTIEYEIFNTTLAKVLALTAEIQQSCSSIASIDCLICFADLAQKYRYTRPVLVHTGEIHIKEGRHPVVERLLEETQFVPNDVTLDNNQQLLIITGPNMAGKSVFIRQTALIVLMAQIGCYVPATQAKISVVDHLFVRSGASDVITSGLSTFMVEMVETAYILRHATKHSLIVMDEIGRGTSTYDGISIAWAVAEYIVTHEKISSKTLFATHYHELQQLEERYPGKIRNFHMAVIEEEHVPVFLHTLSAGGASASYGVAVAKLAGVPESVIEKATILLRDMESTKHIFQSSQKNDSVVQNTSLPNHPVIDVLKGLDLYRMTPLEAMNVLAKIQEQLKNVQKS